MEAHCSSIFFFFWESTIAPNLFKKKIIHFSLLFSFKKNFSLFFLFPLFLLWPSVSLFFLQAFSHLFFSRSLAYHLFLFLFYLFYFLNLWLKISSSLFFFFLSFFQKFSLFCGGNGFCAGCGCGSNEFCGQLWALSWWVLWLVVSVVLMGFVASCGCGDDRFCWLWLWLGFFGLCFLCGGFCGQLWVWLWWVLWRE